MELSLLHPLWDLKTHSQKKGIMESGATHTDVKALKDFILKEDTIIAGKEQKVVTLNITIKKMYNNFFYLLRIL
ncbi:MAG TPA: hypothetical protein VN703_01045 [Candidatus Sulfopaludibacter sp.]|nr:hypothetical protein [Candidatus Sulfopaludibacter sp.]